MSNHISKHHVGEEPLIKKQKLSAESSGSASESHVVKATTMQSALPVILQKQSQGQAQLNVIFVVNGILKMGLPVFMAVNEGLKEWLAMLHGGVDAIEVSMFSMSIWS